MAEAAAEPQRAGRLAVERAAALRTAEVGGLAARLELPGRRLVARCDPRLENDLLRDRWRLPHRLGAERSQYRCNLRGFAYPCIRYCAQRRLRHVGIGGLGRALDNRNTAAAGDGRKARGTVVERSAQDDPDGTAAKGDRRGAEQHIDRGAPEILARSTGQEDSLALEQHVPLGGRDQESTGTNDRAVFREEHPQRSTGCEHLIEPALPRGKMSDEEKGARK